MSELIYNRILLKLSGEALMGNSDFGININAITHYAQEISDIVKLGIQVGVVIGGGNIFRGIQGANSGMDRCQSDNMGMLATVINGIALQDALEKINITSRLQSAIEIKRVCEMFIMRRAIRHLEKGRVVIFSAGTGNPYFTTDTAAVLRALEIKSEVIIKVTKVNGVYDSDPKINNNAIKYDKISFNEVISKKLNVMDMTAFTLAEENEIPIIIMDINNAGDLKRLMYGESVGTLVY